MSNMTNVPADQKWSVRIADSVMQRNPILPTWDYETGLALKAIEQVWQKTNGPKYYDYIVANYDRWVNEDGSINKYYVFDEYQLDHIAPGKLLFMLHKTTGKDKYKKAIQLLRSQLDTASHERGWLLAQKDTPLSDVGGWHFHGLAFLRRICQDL